MKKRDESLPLLERSCPSCGAPMAVGNGNKCGRCGAPLVEAHARAERPKLIVGIVVGLIPSIAALVLFEILNRSSGDQTAAVLLVGFIILAGSIVGGWLTSAINSRMPIRVLLAVLFGFGYALLAVAVFFATCVSQLSL